MTLDERIKDVETRNTKIIDEMKSLESQRAEINGRLSTLRDEAIKTTGEHKALLEIKATESSKDAKDEPADTTH